jgi:chemotaxis protein MotB
VLFASGQATLNEGGRQQIVQLAGTLKELIGQIPPEIDWVLQVNGHTDRRPVVNSPYASNWELSQARALSVVRVLIAEGIPPERLLAAGYAEFQPLDPADSEEAYQVNRRIELKLTER